MLIDGVPLARIAAVTTDLGRFSLDAFGEVELYRGAVPVELGGAGLGGALNLVTRLGRGAHGERVSGSLGAGSFGARHAGCATAIDTATDRAVPALTVTLGHANPFGWFEQFPAGSPYAGDLAIATVENFTTAPGCIERITPGAQPRAAGCLVDNAMLGGYSSRLDIESDADGEIVRALVGIPGDFAHRNLRTFDRSLNALWPDPLNPSPQLISDLVHCPSGQVVVFDSTTGAPGLRIYDGAETTTAALPIGKIQALFPQHGLICY